MKVTVTKSDLRDALAHVLPAVAVKPGTPVLAGIYLQTEGSSALVLRATNFELDITAKIPANIEVEGKTVTTGKHFAAIVNKLGGDIVTLIDANNQLTIRSEAASFDILTMDADDFPKPLKLDSEKTFRIHRDVFKNLIRRTVFACAKDESRPVFTGVNFALEGTNITAVATNTSRIAIAKDKIFDETEANIIVPAAALRILQSASDENTSMTVTLNGNRNITFDFDNIRFVSRLIGGTFPSYDKIIPTSAATSAKIDISELRAAIDRIQIISSETDYKQVNMIFTREGLEVSASSNNIGKAVEHVDANVTGDDLEIAFNYSYLLDAFKAFDGDKCTFSMNQELTPVIIKGDDEDFIYIITPLRTH